MTPPDAVSAQPAGWRTARAVFAAPIFPEDPAKSRKASLLNLAFWFFVCLGLVGTVGNMFGPIPAGVSYVNLAVLLLAPFIWRWARQGRQELAAFVLLLNAFVSVTLAIVLIGTTRLPSLGVYALITMVAGYIFGSRGMLFALTSSSLAVGVLILAERQGLLPPATLGVTATQWVTATALFACIGGVAVLSHGHLTQALGRVEHEVAERRRTEEELRSANARLQEALASVKTLRGLIPVCGWCRKVRDDAGYWSALEQYVIDHTDATISHGICPECRRVHFPEIKEQDEPGGAV